jgi:hypothetical protein
MWENEDEKNRTQGRGKETEWKHIEDKSGKPWRRREFPTGKKLGAKAAQLR